LERFSQILLTPDGDLQFSLDFSRQEDSRTRIHGEVSASLEFECQICLETFVDKVSCRIDAIVVNRFEELLELEQHENGIVAEKSFISLAEIVEDELILAMPMIPRHLSGDCFNRKRDGYNMKQEEKTVAQKSRDGFYKPFEDLAKTLDRIEERENLNGGSEK
tara:strand:+ start:316 stop:804 length:489 start_codon:yes stop_codon:yes gene_type:complete